MIIELTVFLAVALLVGSISYKIWRKSQKKAIIPEKLWLTLLKLQPKITWCRYLENIQNFGIRLDTQYKTITTLYLSSVEVLKQKFNTSEITYVRYLQSIQATNMILMDNLNKLIPLLETLDHMNTKESNTQSSLIAKVESLLNLNEELIEKLNNLIVNLSDIKSLSGPDEKETKFLLDNLNTLIQRAKTY